MRIHRKVRFVAFFHCWTEKEYFPNWSAVITLPLFLSWFQTSFGANYWFILMGWDGDLHCHIEFSLSFWFWDGCVFMILGWFIVLGWVLRGILGNLSLRQGCKTSLLLLLMAGICQQRWVVLNEVVGLLIIYRFSQSWGLLTASSIYYSLGLGN